MEFIISTPRSNRRVGGAAITLISDSQFVLTKLNIDVLDGDYSLEVCWGLLKPQNPTGHIKSIIVCSFYSPPNSRKKSALINHIVLTTLSSNPNTQNQLLYVMGTRMTLTYSSFWILTPALDS